MKQTLSPEPNQRELKVATILFENGKKNGLIGPEVDPESWIMDKIRKNRKVAKSVPRY